ncbi:unnamed protein product, partial [marine sediment metagenome]
IGRYRGEEPRVNHTITVTKINIPGKKNNVGASSDMCF